MKVTVSFCTAAVGVLALATLNPSRALAGPVFMWVANGSSVTGYDSSGNTIASTTSVSGLSVGNYFALAVAGSSSNQNIFVSDSQNHNLTEFNWNGTSLTEVGTPYGLVNDPSGGGISPQEIALDASGNLWTVNADGQIIKYANATGTATTVQAANGALGGARGIMIDTRNGGTGNVYVTIDGYGTGFVEEFSPTTPSTITTVGQLSSTTIGGNATGQLRGITEDTTGDIFYADSTWGQGTGYICEIPSTTATGTIVNCGASGGIVYSGLNGPNEMISGAGWDATTGNPAGTGTYGTGCDVLFVANYYSGAVDDISTGENLKGQAQGPNKCGNTSAGVNSGTLSLLYTISNATGLALAPTGTSLTIGGNDWVPGPTFIESAALAETPEPATWALAIVVLASMFVLRMFRRRAHAAGAPGAPEI